MTRTAWLLLARYEGLPLIPVDRVCADFFAPLTLPRFLRKIADGDIPLPLVRMDRSQKAAKAVHVDDLAAYLDARRDEALAEYGRMHR